MAFDIHALTQSDLAQLKQLLGGLTDVSGRSPIKPRQLHDLRLRPTATDPRPTFVWSAESPRDQGDLTQTELYPRLMWHGMTGTEVTAKDSDAQATYTASGYVLRPPQNAPALDPMDELAAELESLSESDRKALFQAMHADRIQAIQSKLAGLSETQSAAIMAAATASDNNQGKKRGAA